MKPSEATKNLQWGDLTAGKLDKEIMDLRTVENMTLAQIAEELNISLSEVHRRLHTMGFSGRISRTTEYGRLKAMSKEELEAVYEENSSSDLAEMAGVAESTINRLLKKRGIPRRRNEGWLNLRLRVVTTVGHRYFAHKLVEAGLDLRWDWMNYPVMVGTHKIFFIDIAIPDVKIGMEIDGTTHKTDQDHDAVRDGLLISEGWQIYHFDHTEAYLKGGKTAKKMIDVIRSAGSTAVLPRVPGNLSVVRQAEDIVRTTGKPVHGDKEPHNT